MLHRSVLFVEQGKRQKVVLSVWVTRVPEIEICIHIVHLRANKNQAMDNSSEKQWVYSVRHTGWSRNWAIMWIRDDIRDSWSRNGSGVNCSDFRRMNVFFILFSWTARPWNKNLPDSKLNLKSELMFVDKSISKKQRGKKRLFSQFRNQSMYQLTTLAPCTAKKGPHLGANARKHR